ncbi:MAG: hypothetical protein A3F09_02820 [Chlamydiae bacterium RIFCSPHIGHO2_12_FULL_49_11]|nr:MAG: hypothetical protein A3F09_02820 [Chlamydiae bacterium RIFCSPHIGHO2_12_FULL_49_11]
MEDREALNTKSKYKVILTCIWSLLFSTSFCAQNILNHLDFSCYQVASHIPGIDAVFVIQLEENEKLSALHEELQQHDVQVFDYNKFQKIPEIVLTSYCSSIVSPFLLTEILSHLSIYQYCLNQGINRVLILESHASLMKDPRELSQLLTTLNEKTRGYWDVLYTDSDFHHPQTGLPIVPNLHYIPKNKKAFLPGISKVFCRYGAASFVISKSGMKKVLQYFQTRWDNLPFDQILFRIPRLYIYGVDTDIITNRYSTKPSENVHLEKLKKKEKLYQTGNEFWIDPVHLLTHDRFDAAAKYIYAKYQLKHYRTQWHVDLYKKHLENWISFYNTEPLKIGFPAFLSAFNTLIKSLQNKRFDPTYPIDINNLGLACNGSHRIGTCLAMQIPVKVRVESGEGSPSMTASAFRNLYSLEEKYLDHMAYEYAKLKDNTVIVSLFPAGYQFRKEVENILNKYGTVVHDKDIWLTESGCLEYIRLVYNGEWWTGSYLDNFQHSKAKAALCFPRDLRENSPVKVYLYECETEAIARVAKEAVRTLCNYGNESVHINNNHNQTKIIAASVFNENSIAFMNKKKLNIHPQFHQYMKNLHAFIGENPIDPEEICIDTGCVLAAYGLRDTKDIDVIHKCPLPSTYQSYNVDSHNPHLHHHSKPLDEILFNPENHFYYQGIKFVSIDLVRKMKWDRHSEKDLVDIELIDAL